MRITKKGEHAFFDPIDHAVVPDADPAGAPLSLELLATLGAWVVSKSENCGAYGFELIPRQCVQGPPRSLRKLDSLGHLQAELSAHLFIRNAFIGLGEGLKGRLLVQPIFHLL